MKWEFRIELDTQEQKQLEDLVKNLLAGEVDTCRNEAGEEKEFADLSNAITAERTSVWIWEDFIIVHIEADDHLPASFELSIIAHKQPQSRPNVQQLLQRSNQDKRPPGVEDNDNEL